MKNRPFGNISKTFKATEIGLRNIGYRNRPEFGSMITDGLAQVEHSN